MTEGEKLIWASTYGASYARHSSVDIATNDANGSVNALRRRIISARAVGNDDFNETSYAALVTGR